MFWLGGVGVIITIGWYMAKKFNPELVRQGDELLWIEVGKLNGNRAGRSAGRPAWLNPTVASSFVRMREAAKAEGVDIRLNSAGRTYAHQERLYNEYLAMMAHWRAMGSPEGQKPTPVARPGMSRHNKAKAVDVETVGARGQRALAWMRANASRFGWRETVAREPWHWERA